MRLGKLLLSVALSIAALPDPSAARIGSNAVCTPATPHPDHGKGERWTVSQVIAAFGTPASTTTTLASRYFYQRGGCAITATTKDGIIESLEGEPPLQACIHALQDDYQPKKWPGLPVTVLAERFGAPDSKQENIRMTHLYYSRPNCRASVFAEDDLVTWIVSVGGDWESCYCPETAK